jgi:hypothetical protein
MYRCIQIKKQEEGSTELPRAVDKTLCASWSEDLSHNISSIRGGVRCLYEKRENLAYPRCIYETEIKRCSQIIHQKRCEKNDIIGNCVWNGRGMCVEKNCSEVECVGDCSSACNAFSTCAYVKNGDGSNAGKCVRQGKAELCEHYVRQSDCTETIDGTKCEWGGGACENSKAGISSCNGIRDSAGCVSTREKGHLYMGLGDTRCEWVKVDGEEKCVHDKSVRSCSSFAYANYCKGGFAYATGSASAAVGMGVVSLTFC